MVEHGCSREDGARMRRDGPYLSAIEPIRSPDRINRDRS
ncbi:hypothetical protein BSIN_2913 [Burkholderia singularis]|uniref:Uncharacterized protein n=1 Tax=Burkholderia singularis TaxID=1503053 RepID=A0A238H3E7_9BURK|nr:hypothetical protein BSIN_2913 [Burkholderia singularis]